MDAEFFGRSARDQAVHIVSLVPEERQHQHWYSVADSLIDTMSSSVGHEYFGFGMSYREKVGTKAVQLFGELILGL